MIRFITLSWKHSPAMDRYCFWPNFLSKARSCWVVNGVRGFRFGLCFRRVHFCGGIPWLPFDSLPVKKIQVLRRGMDSEFDSKQWANELCKNFVPCRAWKPIKEEIIGIWRSNSLNNIPVNISTSVIAWGIHVNACMCTPEALILSWCKFFKLVAKSLSR